MSSVLTSEPKVIALVGNPNCGKTALFNLLTGSRQKVANYAGVTVERKIGSMRLGTGQSVSVIDLPGAYSMKPSTPDERVMMEVITGQRAGEAAPDAIVAVVDATNLRMNLRLVLELARLGKPLIVALNMADVARANGLNIDVQRLARELGCPVVATVAVHHNGHAALLTQLEMQLADLPVEGSPETLPPGMLDEVNAFAEPLSAAELQKRVRRILSKVAPQVPRLARFQYELDALVMHPVWGVVILATILFLIFQAVFSWATVPMNAIRWLVNFSSDVIEAHMDEGPLRSLLVDGVMAGVGSVLVFLPQILILYFFILLLED